MPNTFKGRSFIDILDYSAEEISQIIDLAIALKNKKLAGVYDPLIEHKNIALVFEKTSTRTRCAFEVAAYDEGAHVTYLGPDASQLGKKESVADTAKVLARYYDAIEYRGFEQAFVEELAKHSGLPVYNGLSDESHPTQILADLMTVKEKLGKPFSSLKIAFVGDIRNNMSISWIKTAAILGMSFVAYGPKELAEIIPSGFIQSLEPLTAKSGAQIQISDSLDSLKGSDAVYTDIWASMGEESSIEERAALLSPYKVTDEVMAAAGNSDVIFMHCLPSYHDFGTDTAKKYYEMGIDIREVDDSVFLSDKSVVFDEAENRLHTIKALLVATLSDIDSVFDAL
ncbi:MAG: ornithine carbamoyltransferase [Eubacteriaceae bacterium]|nr:ornithine carbamoyltransferase [Eubacteriaceae bacterium]